MLEYLDGVRESRSGVSKNTQGLNDNALTSHTTATAVAQVMTAAQARVELIARNFAETGVKDLMSTIYELLQKNQDTDTVIGIRGTWLPITPSAWRDKYDCTVAVGLGHGNRDQQLMHLSQLIQFATQALSGGLGIVNEQNLYNIAAQVIKNMGFANVQDFLTDPSQQQQEPNAGEQAMALESQIKQKEVEIKMGELQLKAQKLQLDQAALQVETQLKVAELKLEAEQKRPVAIGAT